MKRLLCIVGGMNAGGAETFLMKIYRKLDKSKYQMDFAVAVKGVYDAEILSMGGKIYYIVPKSEGVYKNFSAIKKIVSENSYKYVLRTSQHSLSALELFAAWLGGAEVRAFRSSNSNTTTGSKIQLLIHKICRFMPRLFANIRFAPSTEAAEYMFGKGCIENKTASLLHNGIDLEYFKFEKSAREEIRKEFNIDDGTTVLGHIGRFNQQKNHSFLLDVFKEVKAHNSHAVLLLVGKGELEQEIEFKVEQLGLSDSVVFTGVRSDIPAILSAMDVFVFPSFYEGMPNTVIEAQGCSLPCLVSDTVTKEAAITPLVKYLPLDINASEWADAILNSIKPERGDTNLTLREQGYDISDVVNQFVEVIFNDGKL